MTTERITHRIATLLLDVDAQSFTVPFVAGELKVSDQAVHNSFTYLGNVGAIKRLERGWKGKPGVWAIDDVKQLQMRANGAMREIPTFAPVATDTPYPEPEPIPETASDDRSFAVDSDGDLQLLRPDAEPIVMPNADARRLVAFVALQASAILMAEAQ